MPYLKKPTEDVSALTVLEAAELSKLLEEKWGVSAAAAVAVAASEGVSAATVAENARFDLVLTGDGGKKIDLIKELRAITGLGLTEAKLLVESAPKVIKEGLSKGEADNLKNRLENAGGTAALIFSRNSTISTEQPSIEGIDSNKNHETESNELLRLAMLFSFGSALAYILSPLSPVPEVDILNWIALISLPIGGLIYVLIQTARRRI